MKGIPGPPGSCGTRTKPGALTETVLWDDNRKTRLCCLGEERLGLGRTVREAQGHLKEVACGHLHIPAIWVLGCKTWTAPPPRPPRGDDSEKTRFL